jgi:hypothetical protein
MTVSWPVFFASAALVFIALNGTFALVFLLGHEPIANVPTCVCRKPRPFDLVEESRNVGHDGRAVLLSFKTVGFAVQVDQPA